MASFDIFFNENMFQTQRAKADLLCRLDRKEQALACLLRAYRNNNILYNYLSEKQDDQAIKENQLNRISKNKQSVIIKIVALLTTIYSQNNKSRDYALQLSKHLNLIRETCVLYRLLIQSVCCTKKIELYSQYADFCLQWGRFEEATVALQDRLSVDRDLLKDYHLTLDRLQEIIIKKERFQDIYKQNLKKLRRKLPIKDQKLDQILFGIYLLSKELILIRD